MREEDHAVSFVPPRCSSAIASIFEVPLGPDEPPGAQPRERTSTSCFIMAVIFANSLMDAWVGSHRKPGQTEGGLALRESFGAFCLAIYSAEMLLRMLGFGVWRPKHAYFKRPWCCFDFGIILVAYIQILTRAAGGPHIGNVQVLRSFRAIRILAQAHFWPHVVAHLRALFLCASRCISIICVLVAFILAFAIMGMNMFGGRNFSFCSYENVLEYPVRHCSEDFANNSHAWPMGGHGCSNAWTDHQSSVFVDHSRRALMPTDSEDANIVRRSVEATWNSERAICQKGLVDIDSLDGLHGFETLAGSLALVTTLLNYYQHESIVLPTVDTYGHVTLNFFFAVTLFGSLVLMQYFTAIYVMAYMECMGRFDTDPLKSSLGLASLAANEQGDTDNQEAQGPGNGGGTGALSTKELRGDSPVLNFVELHRRRLSQRISYAFRSPELRHVSFQEYAVISNAELAQHANNAEKQRQHAGTASEGANNARQEGKEAWIRRVTSVLARLSHMSARVLVYPFPLDKIPAGRGLEVALPITPWSQHLMCVMTVLQGLVVLLKEEDMPRWRSHLIAQAETLLLVFFMLQCSFKMLAYGGWQYFLVAANNFDLSVTFVTFLGWAGAMLTAQGINTYTARDPEDPSSDAPVINLGPATGLATLFAARYIRCLSLLVVVPGMRTLVHDGFRCGWKSCITVVLVFLLIMGLVGQQLFGDVMLSGFSGRFKSVPFFATYQNSLFVAWLVMSSENVLPATVEGYHQAGLSMFLYIVFGGMVIRLVVMKGSLATFLDNFEQKESDKIEHQLYARDKEEREQAQNARHATVVEILRSEMEFKFSTFQYAKSEVLPGTGNVDADFESPAIIGTAYVTPHLSDTAGTKRRLELSQHGLLSVYHMPTGFNSLLPGIYSKTHTLARQIPLAGSLVCPQSQCRAKEVAQPSCWSLVIRPDSHNPAFKDMHKVFEETLLFFASRERLGEWVQHFVQNGATCDFSGIMHICELQQKKKQIVQGFSPKDVEEDLAMRPFSEIFGKNKKKTEPSTLIMGLKRFFWKLRLQLFPPEHGISDLQSKSNGVLHHVFESKIFKLLTLPIAVAFVVLTVLDPPTSESIVPQTPRTKMTINLGFLCLFAFEWLAKVHAYGARKIMTDLWELLHLFATISMVVELLAFSLQASDDNPRVVDNLQECIRVSRMLRPLLILRRLESFQITMDCLWKAKEKIFQCFCIASLLVFVLVAMYIEVYSGRLHSCNHPVHPLSSCAGVLQRPAMTPATSLTRGSSSETLSIVSSAANAPILMPLVWTSSTTDFDNQLRMVTTLGMIACPFSQGWAELAETLMCVKGRGVTNEFQDFFAALPLMIIILILHVVMFSLLVAVLLRSLRETDGQVWVTDSQRAWVTTLRLVRRSNLFMKAAIKSGSSQGLATSTRPNKIFVIENVCRRVIEDSKTRLLSDSLIFINLLLLIATGGGGAGTSSATLALARLVVVLLLLEQVLESVGHASQMKATKSLIVVAITLISAIEVFSFQQVSLVLVLRTPSLLLQLSRLYILIPQLLAIQEILGTYCNTLRSAASCFVLLLCYLVIFSIIGVECFSGVKYGVRGITAQSNYDTYLSAFELNVRLALGTPYIPVLRALESSWPSCTRDPSEQGTLVTRAGMVGDKYMIASTGAFVPKTGDCGSSYAWFYLFGLIAVTRVCLLPMFTSTVVSALLESIDDQRSCVSWSDITVFMEEWKKLDCKGRMALPRWKMLKLMDSLHKRDSVLVRLRATNNRVSKDNQAHSLPLHKDRARFTALLDHLSACARRDAVLRTCKEPTHETPPSMTCTGAHPSKFGLSSLRQHLFGNNGKKDEIEMIPEKGDCLAYEDVLRELIACYAFPNAMVWGNHIALGDYLQETSAKIVAMETSHLIFAIRVIREALYKSAKCETEQEQETHNPPSSTCRPVVLQDSWLNDAKACPATEIPSFEGANVTESERMSIDAIAEEIGHSDHDSSDLDSEDEDDDYVLSDPNGALRTETIEIQGHIESVEAHKRVSPLNLAMIEDQISEEVAEIANAKLKGDVRAASREDSKRGYFQGEGDVLKPNLPYFGLYSKRTEKRRNQHIERMKTLIADNHEISLPEIHKLLAKRIFIHIGSNDKSGDHDKLDDPTFVLLCKGCCSSGQAGLVTGRDAEVWAKQLLSRPEGLWHLTTVDAVAIAIPSRKKRARAIRTLLSARGTPPVPFESEKLQSAAKIEARVAKDDISLRTSEVSLLSNATFSHFLKPQREPANLLVGGRGMGEQHIHLIPIGCKEQTEKDEAGDLTTIEEIGDDVSESLAGSTSGVEQDVGLASSWDEVVLSTASQFHSWRRSVSTSFGLNEKSKQPGIEVVPSRPVVTHNLPLHLCSPKPQGHGEDQMHVAREFLVGVKKMRLAARLAGEDGISPDSPRADSVQVPYFKEKYKMTGLNDASNWMKGVTGGTRSGGEVASKAPSESVTSTSPRRVNFSPKLQQKDQSGNIAIRELDLKAHQEML